MYVYIKNKNIQKSVDFKLKDYNIVKIFGQKRTFKKY